MTFMAPYLTYRDVGKYAEVFLIKYHPELKLPIPIEGIIEFDLGLNIVPIPNLYKTFKQSGFLTSDRKIIYIDINMTTILENTDLPLHMKSAILLCMSQSLKGFPLILFRNILNLCTRLPKSELEWYEKQSDWFAEQLLVPTIQHEKYCIDLLESNRNQLSDIKSFSHEFWSYASNELSDYFEVNPKVIEIRILRENFVEKFKNYYQMR